MAAEVDVLHQAGKVALGAGEWEAARVFEFELHPLGPEVATAMVLYPYQDTESVLRAWRDYARQAPETITPEIGLWSIPPLPDIPGELHGSPVVIAAGVYIGPASAAGPALAPLRQLGTPWPT